MKVSMVTSCVCVFVCVHPKRYDCLKCNAGRQKRATNMFITRFKRVIETHDSNMRGKKRMMGTAHRKDCI